jgi:hypothetical protein
MRKLSLGAEEATCRSPSAPGAAAASHALSHASPHTHAAHASPGPLARPSSSDAAAQSPAPASGAHATRLSTNWPSTHRLDALVRPAPPPSPCTNWTRLILPPVLSGHVSPAAPRPARRSLVCGRQARHDQTWRQTTAAPPAAPAPRARRVPPEARRPAPRAGAQVEAFEAQGLLSLCGDLLERLPSQVRPAARTRPAPHSGRDHSGRDHSGRDHSGRTESRARPASSYGRLVVPGVPVPGA